MRPYGKLCSSFPPFPKTGGGFLLAFVRKWGLRQPPPAPAAGAGALLRCSPLDGTVGVEKCHEILVSARLSPPCPDPGCVCGEKGVAGGPQSAGVTPGGVPLMGSRSPRRGLGIPECVCGAQGGVSHLTHFSPISPQLPVGLPTGSTPFPQEDQAPLCFGALCALAIYLKFHFFLQFYTLGSSGLLISWKYQQPPG